MLQRILPSQTAAALLALACASSDPARDAPAAADPPVLDPPARSTPVVAETSAAEELGAPEGSAAPEPEAPLPAPSAACSPPPGVSGSPRNISELVALLDALPKPTSVACLLQSLDRPLELYLTSSGLSAQPSPAPRSPRTFVVLEPLVLSVVPEGGASTLVEVGYRTAPGRSIKLEIAFPLTRPLTPAPLLERVRIGRVSMCGGCHTNEQRVADGFFAAGEGGYESDILPPYGVLEMELDSLRAEAEGCDAAAEPQRCEMLQALFDHGEVRPSTLWRD
jgi:hypothetical protein